jgi:hypothetical protein
LSEWLESFLFTNYIRWQQNGSRARLSTPDENRYIVPMKGHLASKIQNCALMSYAGLSSFLTACLPDITPQRLSKIEKN